MKKKNKNLTQRGTRIGVQRKKNRKKITWGQSKKVAILKPRREARRNQTFQHLDLGLLASRTVRK